MPNLLMPELSEAELSDRLAVVRLEITRLRGIESRLAAKQSRDTRVLEEMAHELLYRYVGFELFDPERAYLLPKKTYVAQSGRYILLGFHEQAQADEMFEAAMKVVS
jgi:hypothetical protein